MASTHTHKTVWEISYFALIHPTYRLTHSMCMGYPKQFYAQQEMNVAISVKQFPTETAGNPRPSYNSIANGRTYLITAASSVKISHISWCFLTSLYSQLTLIMNIFLERNFKHKTHNSDVSKRTVQSNAAGCIRSVVQPALVKFTLRLRVGLAHRSSLFIANQHNFQGVWGKGRKDYRPSFIGL
jgi:hypothetical protein